jgi:plastocyanin
MKANFLMQSLVFVALTASPQLALAQAAPSAALAATPGAISGSVLAPVAKHRAGAVIYVKQGPKPSAAQAAPQVAKMDQKGMVFTPRVLPIAKGWTVEFANSDPVAHSVFTLDGEKYDLGTWPKGEVRKYTFAKTGVYRQLCKVHDDMLAFIVVLDTPWFAVSDKTGQFSLRGLPAGKYTLGVWHEKLGAADVQVELSAAGVAGLQLPLAAK